MNTAGIICEYNPFHNGHAAHIDATRRMLGTDAAIVCIMSGNFVQRGDFAVFNKHARAKAAVLCGADLVIELPSPYALSSAERFAAAGVSILDSLKICSHISFGSESGDITALARAAEAIVTQKADNVIKEWLDKGIGYAAAQQKAANAVLGRHADLFLAPNNLLGIEYLKAINASDSSLCPVTVKRTGAAHDSGAGCSASAIRNMLSEQTSGQSAACAVFEDRGPGERGNPKEQPPCSPWEYMPPAAAEVFREEIEAGRGPVTMKKAELAMLSRLRATGDYSKLPDASEGLEYRFARYAASEPAVGDVLEKIKTRRYAMSRLRRMLMCACLGITADDTLISPPYIRVLAMNRTGMNLLKAARSKTTTPVITKPASAKTMPGRVGELFLKEAAATDFYSLAYQEESERTGGREWRDSPVVFEE